MRESEVTSWLRWIAKRHFSRVQQLGAGVCLATGSVLLRPPIQSVLADTAPFFLLIPTVFVTTVIFGILAGMVFLLTGTVLTVALVVGEKRSARPAMARPRRRSFFSLIGTTLVLLGAAMRSLVLAARRAQARADLLAGEMGHRVKNILALAQVIVSQSANSPDSVKHLVSIVENRFGALSRAQGVAEVHAGSPPLLDLVTDAVAPFGQSRFFVSGEHLAVDRDTAENLGLLLHELATNSMKYGALSMPAGNVSIEWSLEVSGLNLSWKESGGPMVREPTRRGFGTKLAKGLFVADGGGVAIDFASDGLRCSVLVSLVRLIFVEKTR